MERKSGWTVAVIAFVVLMPILYVLSSGPAVWLYSKGLMGDGPFVVYKPLEMVGERSPTFMAALCWYLNWWDGTDRRVSPR
jgi:hypothetical protein